MPKLYGLSLLLLFCFSVASCSSKSGTSSGGNSQTGDEPQHNESVIVDIVESRAVSENSRVELFANVSNTAGLPLTYQWTQTGGDSVTIENAQSKTAYFDAPPYLYGNILLFRFQVLNGDVIVSDVSQTIQIEPEYIFLDVSEGYADWYENIFNSFQHYSFSVETGNEYRIVLRTLLGDADIFVYDNALLRNDDLISSSVNNGFEKDEVIINPAESGTVYMRVASLIDSSYTLNVNQVEPYLEAGFPLETLSSPGYLQVGPSNLMVLVGNVDLDPQLEIVVGGMSSGPLYAWNYDGSLVGGYPEETALGAMYPAIGDLDDNFSSQEIAVGTGPYEESCADNRYIYGEFGTIMPGWPVTNCLAGSEAPLLADINGDGVDEIFFRDAAYYADATEISGWIDLSIENTFQIVNWDGGGDLEVVHQLLPSDLRNPTNSFQVLVQKLDGTVVNGFPTASNLDGYNLIRGGRTVVGDFNKDGKNDIFRIFKVQANPSWLIVEAIANDGTVLWQYETDDSTSYTTDPALGDLNNDGFPEIVVQTEHKIYIWNGDGSLLDGWPVSIVDTEPANHSSSPLIADVTGDKIANVIVTTNNHLKVYRIDGTLLHNIRLHRIGRMQAVADIDLDGRNEVIVASNDWRGFSQFLDTVWAFDLGGDAHGNIEWGQAGGGRKHLGIYPVDYGP